MELPRREDLDPNLPTPKVEPPAIPHPDAMHSLSPGMQDESGMLPKSRPHPEPGLPDSGPPEAPVLDEPSA